MWRRSTRELYRDQDRLLEYGHATANRRIEVDSRGFEDDRENALERIVTGYLRNPPLYEHNLSP